MLLFYLPVLQLREEVEEVKKKEEEKKEGRVHVLDETTSSQVGPSRTEVYEVKNQDKELEKEQTTASSRELSEDKQQMGGMKKNNDRLSTDGETKVQEERVVLGEARECLHDGRTSDSKQNSRKDSHEIVVSSEEEDKHIMSDVVAVKENGEEGVKEKLETQYKQADADEVKELSSDHQEDEETAKKDQEVKKTSLAEGLEHFMGAETTSRSEEIAVAKKEFEYEDDKFFSGTEVQYGNDFGEDLDLEMNKDHGEVDNVVKREEGSCGSGEESEKMDFVDEEMRESEIKADGLSSDSASRKDEVLKAAGLLPIGSEQDRQTESAEKNEISAGIDQVTTGLKTESEDAKDEAAIEGLSGVTWEHQLKCTATDDPHESSVTEKHTDRKRKLSDETGMFSLPITFPPRFLFVILLIFCGLGGTAKKPKEAGETLSSCVTDVTENVVKDEDSCKVIFFFYKYTSLLLFSYSVLKILTTKT